MFGQVKDLLLEGHPQAPELLQHAVTKAERSAFRRTKGNWTLLNLGPLTVPEGGGLVALHYFACCPNWFRGWEIDWVAFMPVGLIGQGVTLYADMPRPK